MARFKATDRQSDINNPPQCQVENIRSPDFTFLFDARWQYITGAYDKISIVHQVRA